MDNPYKTYKDNFIKRYCCEKREISFKEFNALDEEAKKSSVFVEKEKFYIKVPLTFENNEELNEYIQLEMFKMQKNMSINIGKIKNMLVFWLVLTIIFLSLSIFSLLI